MVDRNFFSKIPGADFKYAGNNNTGPLYHWYWHDRDLTGDIEKLLIDKKFTKGSFFTATNATAHGKFTRVEMPVNFNPNEIIFHVEYFDGTGNYNDPQFIKSNIKERINILTFISIIGSIASVCGVILGIIALCQ